MKALCTMSLTVMLVACDSQEKIASPENPDEKTITPPASPPVPPRSPEARAFDDKLAAIHEEWMGTAWTFSGTSQNPKEGSIACGYFVTTTLQQAGVEVARVRLAQAASETMILATTPRETVKRYSDTPLEDFLESVKRQGEGYYIVGLDNHTGFLKVDPNGDVLFIHSGPGRGVVKERPEEAPELANSRYRVIGKLPNHESIEEQ